MSLREAAEAILALVEGEMSSAYNRARAVCCNRPGPECCGSPEPEWDEADTLRMDVLAPVQKALRAALAEAPKAEPVESAEAELSDELKPCPFCGGRPELTHIETNEDDPNFGGRYIECKSCGACTCLVFACGDDPNPILAEKWNARAVLAHGRKG